MGLINKGCNGMFFACEVWCIIPSSEQTYFRASNIKERRGEERGGEGKRGEERRGGGEERRGEERRMEARREEER